MKKIEIEDIATIFASEFCKENTRLLQRKSKYKNNMWETHSMPFLKMNYSQRRKIVEKVLDRIHVDAKQTINVIPIGSRYI